MKLGKKLENIFAAAAFAEAGEPETAREIMKEGLTENKRDAAHKEKNIQISMHATKA